MDLSYIFKKYHDGRYIICLSTAYNIPDASCCFSVRLEQYFYKHKYKYKYKCMNDVPIQ